MRKSFKSSRWTFPDQQKNCETVSSSLPLLDALRHHLFRKLVERQGTDFDIVDLSIEKLALGNWNEDTCAILPIWNKSQRTKQSYEQGCRYCICHLDPLEDAIEIMHSTTTKFSSFYRHFPLSKFPWGVRLWPNLKILIRNLSYPRSRGLK